MRNENLLKSRVSEIRVKQIRINQGVGVHNFCLTVFPADYHTKVCTFLAKEKVLDSRLNVAR